jgi:hypothetical protein
MKRIHKLILAASLLTLSIPGWSQNTDETLLFSRDNLNGSARIQAMGGTQISLGGDLSNLQGNPAGLGFYNSSEFSITPSFGLHIGNTNYMGNADGDFKMNPNVQNGAAIFTGSRNYSPSSLWKGGTFGISFNRSDDYQQHFTFSGFNPNNSIADYFIQQADGVPLSVIENSGDYLGMAYRTFLINPGADGYYHFPSDSIGYPEQQKTVTSHGAKYQWNISYGGNIDDFLYFGLGVGVVSFDYNQEQRLYEYFPKGDIVEIELKDQLNVKGDGLNLTAGIIARPNEYLSLGATFTSPTVYSIERESYSDLLVGYDYLPFEYNDTTITLYEEIDESDRFISDYRIITPMKLSGGITYFFGKQGFISSDVEFVDYSSIRTSSSDYGFDASSLNREIKDLLKPVVNWRIGGEWRYDLFRLRAGYAFNGTPYRDSEVSASKQNFTLGAGIRTADYFVDFALVHSRYAPMNYSPYVMQPEYINDGEQAPWTKTPVAEINRNSTQAMVTLGWLF